MQNPQDGTSRSEAPLGRPSRRAAALRYTGAVVVVSASALAVLVLWRPAPAGAVPGKIDFAEAVAVTDIASAAVELPLYGYSEVTLGQQEGNLNERLEAAPDRFDNAAEFQQQPQGQQQMQPPPGMPPQQQQQLRPPPGQTPGQQGYPPAQ